MAKTTKQNFTTSRRIRDARALIDVNKTHDVAEAIVFLKDNTKAKCDESIDMAIKLGIDPKLSDQNVRGVTSLPAGTGKDVKVAVFAKDANAEAAKKAGADIIGAENLVETIKGGTIDFDRCIATPDLMALVGQVAKILGPKGLMPNPKLGTVTTDVAKAVQEAKAGQVEFRAEKAGIVHVAIGKASFEARDLLQNISALLKALKKAKPDGLKGNYIEKITLSSTFGVGLTVDVSTIIE